MNDKTRQIQKRGREPNEKAVQLRGDVRRCVRAYKLGHATAGRCLASTATAWNICGSTDDRLASSQSQKRLVVIP